ncbi:MAG TPA: Hsp20/alpha crystallin family protein [Pirellulaceae bacterium]|nr:Hsp20/alpha crystallin family protein [Pirellulaceae bacterium]
MSTTLTPSKPQVKSPAAPRDALTVFRTEMDDLLSRIWNGGEESWFPSVFSPAADVAETDNAYQVRMDIPGMKASDIDVQVHGNQVTISGQRKEEKEEKGKTFHRIERRSGNFCRSMTLPCNVNESEVAADYTQGVLTVLLPKCEEAKTKKISVKG